MRSDVPGLMRSWWQRGRPPLECSPPRCTSVKSSLRGFPLSRPSSSSTLVGFSELFNIGGFLGAPPQHWWVSLSSFSTLVGFSELVNIGGFL